MMTLGVILEIPYVVPSSRSPHFCSPWNNLAASSSCVATDEEQLLLSGRSNFSINLAAGSTCVATDEEQLLLSGRSNFSIKPRRPAS
jgi:hypothetical protein